MRRRRKPVEPEEFDLAEALATCGDRYVAKQLLETTHGNMPRCVACGNEIEVTASGLADHHCPPEYENAKYYEQLYANDRGVPVSRTVGQRLSQGFRMMNDDWDGS